MSESISLYAWKGLDFITFIDLEYMKIIYVNCGWRREYESDHRNDGHHLSSSEQGIWTHDLCDTGEVLTVCIILCDNSKCKTDTTDFWITHDDYSNTKTSANKKGYANSLSKGHGESWSEKNWHIKVSCLPNDRHEYDLK